MYPKFGVWLYIQNLNSGSFSMCKVYLEQDYLDSMYVLLRMPFKVYPVPCFIIFLPECTEMGEQAEYHWIQEATWN